MANHQPASSKKQEPLDRILANIRDLGLTDHLLELETQGYTTIPGVLSPAKVERAKAAIIARVERTSGRKVDAAEETGAAFNGMQYVPYLLYDDAVFEEILMEEKPLALVTWLLGESCLLSSMGCHFRGPGGMPLMLHSDNGNGMPAPFSPISMVANINYALTPYSREAGCLAMVPGSHRLQRQPTVHENFRPRDITMGEMTRLSQAGQTVDDLEWNDPPGVKPMTLLPGDAVIWHGNTWHGSFRRDLSGVRMNLAVYCNRQFVQTQERHEGPERDALIERHANDPRFAVLLGSKQPYGWRREGPDYRLMARNPRGLHD